MNDTSGLSLGTHQGITVAFNNATGANSLAVNGTNLTQGTPNPSDVRLNIATGSGTVLEGATPTVAGIMTAADKAKLDTLPVGGAAALAEVIQDVAGTMLLNGTHTGCTVFYNDNTGTVSITNTAGGSGGATTNLALGAATSSTQPITSSTGTGVTLQAATISTAGLMTAGDKQAVDALNVLGINSSAAFNEAAQDAAALLLTSGTHSGVTVVYDDVTGRLNLTVSGGGGNVQSNLALGTATATTQPVTNSDGTGFTLASATTLAAGLFQATDKVKLDTYPASYTAPTVYTDEQAQDAAAAMFVGGTHTGISVSYDDAGNTFSLSSTSSGTTNLGIGAVTATTVPLTSSSGTGATIPSVTSSLAGVMLAADKVKLDALPATIPASDLSLGTATATTLPLNISTGADVVLPSATTTTAGLLAAADQVKLNAYPSYAAATATNVPTSTALPVTVNVLGVAAATTLPAATTALSGVMQAADRINLNLVPVDGLLKLWSADPTHMGVGAITYDAGGALTSFSVVWPDGGTGVYTATTVNATFPTAVDAFTVTYVAPVGGGGTNKTVTQPLVTRDASGRVSNSPARTIA